MARKRFLLSSFFLLIPSFSFTVFSFGLFLSRLLCFFFEDDDCVVDATFTFPTNLHISLAAFMAL